MGFAAKLTFFCTCYFLFACLFCAYAYIPIEYIWRREISRPKSNVYSNLLVKQFLNVQILLHLIVL